MTHTLSFIALYELSYYTRRDGVISQKREDKNTSSHEYIMGGEMWHERVLAVAEDTYLTLYILIRGSSM